MKQTLLSNSFVLRSTDEGETWELATLAKPVKDASGEETGFTETALVETPDGRVLAMMLHHLRRWHHPDRRDALGFEVTRTLRATLRGAVLASAGSEPSGLRSRVDRAKAAC